MSRTALVTAGLGLALVVGGCTTSAAPAAGPTASVSSATGGQPVPSQPPLPANTNTPANTTTPANTSTPANPTTAPTGAAVGGRPGGIYRGTAASDLSAVASTARPLVYVPDSVDNTVHVIDQRSLRVVATFPVDREPQHVVPSWDLRTLYVNDDLGNDLVPIDPRTGRRGPAIPVTDPYNLYSTPDGRHVLVMAERMHRIDVRDPRTLHLQRSIPVPCSGVNHADFTADGATMLVSCEYSGKLLVIPVATLDRVTRVVDLNRISTPGATTAAAAARMGGPASLVTPGTSAMPQDVRIVDDGSAFVVADMLRNGVWVVDARTFGVRRFIRTGMGAHGIYPSRDATRLFVSNRDGGSVSVLDGAATRVLTTWELARGASPDMGGVSLDGTRLWLSGRYDSCVYVIDTASGRTEATISVGRGPHGLLVWPQPGRHSLGHTGNMR